MKPAATTHHGQFGTVLWLAAVALGGCSHAGLPSAAARAGDAAGTAWAAPAEGLEPASGAAPLQLRLELVPGIGSISLREVVGTDRFSVKLKLDRELRGLRSVLDAASCQADVEWRLRYVAAAGREDRFKHRARRDI